MATAGALAAALTLYGCTGMIEQPTALPARNSIVFDQLTIYSNFPLPRHHRLLDDLRVQRGELLGKLNLPPSDEPIHVYLFETEEKFDDFLAQTIRSFLSGGPSSSKATCGWPCMRNGASTWPRICATK